MATEHLETKKELLTKLTDYAVTPDDPCILYKERIKENLLKCPELLYALNAEEYEKELFNSDGTINYDGDWSMYYGTYILPYLYLSEVQTDEGAFLCYNVGFSESPSKNNIECYMQITFTILVSLKYAIDKTTGIARHDLIGSIIRERINWSNVFNSTVKLTSNKESITDNEYIVRTLVFEGTMTNSILKTTNGKTRVINKEVRR